MGRDKTVGLRADEGLVYRREPHIHFPDDQLLITRIGLGSRGARFAVIKSWWLSLFQIPGLFNKCCANN